MRWLTARLRWYCGVTAFFVAAFLSAQGEPAADANAAIAQARLYAEAKLVRQALEVLAPLRDSPARQQILSEAGRIRFAAGDHEGAATDYQALLELLPRHPVVERNLLMALHRAHRNAEAGELLTAMGPRAEASSWALAVRGLLAERAGERAAAVADLEAAMALDGDPFAAYELGVLYLAAGDPAAAVAPLEEALRRRPGAVQPMYNLGQALVRSGRTERGHATLAEARELTAAANEVLTRRMRAVALAMRAQEAMARGDAAAALRDLDRALELAPGDPDLTRLRQSVAPEPRR